MAIFNLNVNSTQVQVDVDSDTPMLWVLRDELNLKGTKFGCGIAQCGACTIHMNGEAVRSCSLSVSAVGEAEITTIEGISVHGDHPVQAAWSEQNVPQCGYCQPGQIMSAIALLQTHSNPPDSVIDQAMSGNICRCGTYPRIKKAIHSLGEEAEGL
jgi:aerobic-type carbon monoxide dehydrogenase small subunit (CoxS/CutS family)